uniref:Uncharacterized protein n=1 Tax=Rhizophagus irregularis (strain DAOM 181602 / DAOM 197198 / MUCL 43194) TaxID=747089 RepID=U9T024_RHIID
MTEQYIKSSDIALLYSEMDSHKDTLPKRRIATKEDYNMMYHIFINYQWYNKSLQALE